MFKQGSYKIKSGALCKNFLLNLTDGGASKDYFSKSCPHRKKLKTEFLLQSQKKSHFDYWSPFR
jgi:hypothetical protein